MDALTHRMLANQISRAIINSEVPRTPHFYKSVRLAWCIPDHHKNALARPRIQNPLNTLRFPRNNL